MSRTIKATFSISENALDRIRSIAMGKGQTIKDTIQQALACYEASLDQGDLATYRVVYAETQRIKRRF